MEPGLAGLAAAWVIYFAVHSALADLRVKRRLVRRWPGLAPAYRLAYVAIAVVSLLPPLWWLHALASDPLWAWTGPWAWVADGIAILALAGFAWSTRYYDGARFLGLRQWRGHETRIEDQEEFRLSPLHRYVRHPWYTFALMIIWTRDMDPAFLLTAILMTAYFIAGSRLEEHKLVIYHGETYRRYMRRVPGIVPRPWRYLTPADARELLAVQQAADAV